tara:strand:+ start:149 stop:916 length:768 start_codon:yes stop_codon:yes gene_type:complete
MSINTFWISSVPRTGSMWLFNVTREILKVSKFNIYPKETPRSDKDALLIYQNYSLKDDKDENKYILKIHKPLPINMERSKILTTIRDPRDICVSLKEFMRIDFKSALEATKPLNYFIKTYSQYNDKYIKFIKYENMENKNVETLIEIAKFIGLNISLEQAEKISKQYSKKKIKDIIKKNDNRLIEKIKNKERILKKEIVYFSNENFRSYDLNTGFQTGHISNRKSGEWKNKLNKNEIKIINEEFKELLENYKYEI